MTSIVQSRPPAPGREHSYRLEGIPNNACEVQWLINGEPATIGTDQGGLRVEGFGRFEIHVQLDGDLDDLSTTTISAIVDCPGLPREQVSFHAGLGTELGPPLPPAPEPQPPAPDPPDAAPPDDPVPGPPPDPATLAELAEALKPDTSLPPASGDDFLDSVTIDARPWPWGRRIFGQCPEGCTGELGWISIPPFYYTLICECGGVRRKYKLALGIVVGGPDEVE